MPECTMPEDTSGETRTRRYSVEITAYYVPGEEPTEDQIQDFFNAFFSEGFKLIWRAATCDDVKELS
jgi:hypothetical protein